MIRDWDFSYLAVLAYMDLTGHKKAIIMLDGEDRRNDCHKALWHSRVLWHGVRNLRSVEKVEKHWQHTNIRPMLRNRY